MRVLSVLFMHAQALPGTGINGNGNYRDRIGASDTLTLEQDEVGGILATISDQPTSDVNPCYYPAHTVKRSSGHHDAPAAKKGIDFRAKPRQVDPGAP